MLFCGEFLGVLFILSLRCRFLVLLLPSGLLSEVCFRYVAPPPVSINCDGEVSNMMTTLLFKLFVHNIEGNNCDCMVLSL